MTTPLILSTLLASVLQTPESAANVRPLPGNETCAYPPAAASQSVSGPVSFVVRVTPQGRTESVEIQAVPEPGLGFEETVRDCVSRWRYEPAPDGVTAPRSLAATVRYSIAREEEEAIRQLLASLSEAWNAEDKNAIEELETRKGEVPGLRDPRGRFLRDVIEESTGAEECYIVLGGSVSSLRFLLRDLVEVRQPFECVTGVPASVPTGTGPTRSLELTAAKGPRGWRFAQVPEWDRGFYRATRVREGIPEPRKVKNVRPVYPVVARDARVQGVVILECRISVEGKVTDVRILRGIPLLDKAAIDAVRQWEYTPTLLDGVAVPVIMTVTVNFKLS